MIGPSQFVSLVHREVQKEFGDAEIKKSDKLVVDCVHGYERLTRNPVSRLGWRIILHCFSPDKIPEVVKNYVVAGRDFIPALPADFRRKHLSTAALIGRLAQNEDLSAQDERKVLMAAGHSMREIQKLLGTAEEPEQSRDPSLPHIVCTTLLGAKGLAAPHVFMVGMNNGHLPRNPRAVTDDEIRQLTSGRWVPPNKQRRSPCRFRRARENGRRPCAARTHRSNPPSHAFPICATPAWPKPVPAPTPDVECCFRNRFDF